jgi:hypothetical protein
MGFVIGQYGLKFAWLIKNSRELLLIAIENWLTVYDTDDFIKVGLVMDHKFPISSLCPDTR